MLQPAPSELERYVLDKLARLRREADVARQVSAAVGPTTFQRALRALTRRPMRRRFRSRSRRHVASSG